MEVAGIVCVIAVQLLWCLSLDIFGRPVGWSVGWEESRLMPLFREYIIRECLTEHWKSLPNQRWSWTWLRLKYIPISLFMSLVPFNRQSDRASRSGPTITPLVALSRLWHLSSSKFLLGVKFSQIFISKKVLEVRHGSTYNSIYVSPHFILWK